MTRCGVQVQAMHSEQIDSTATQACICTSFDPAFMGSTAAVRYVIGTSTKTRHSLTAWPNALAMAHPRLTRCASHSGNCTPLISQISLQRVV